MLPILAVATRERRSISERGSSNTATVTAANNTGSSTTAADIDTLTPQDDVSVTKVDNDGGSSITAMAGTVVPGNTVTYTIVVSNSGPSTATNVAVSDSLPPGETLQSGALNHTIASLAPNASVTYTVTATVGASATGSLSNTATVTAANNTSSSTTATDTDTLTPENDVSITKVDNDGGSSITSTEGMAVPGATVTYTIVVSNTGPSNATNVAVSDPLPADVTSFTWSGDGLIGQTRALGDTIASLAPNASVTYTVIAAVSASAIGTLSNTATVTAANNTSTSTTAIDTIDVVAPPTIAIAFSPTTIAVGGTSTLTISLTNPAGNDVVESGVAFTDTLPAGLIVATPNGLIDNAGGTATATAGSSSISLIGGSLAVGATDTIVVNVTGNTAGIENDTTGAVSSTNGGTGVASNTASLTVAAPPSISAAFGAASIALNGSTTLTFMISNPNASVALTGVAFTDALPAGLVVATPNGLSNNSPGGGTATATAGSSTVSLAGATIAANGSISFSVNVTGTTAGVENDSVQVTSNEGGTGNAANASITVVAPPTIMQSFSVSSIPLGGSAALSFTVSNTNASTSLTGIGFTETLPAGLVISTPNGELGAAIAANLSANAGANVITLSGVALAPNSSVTFSINVTGIAAGPQSLTTSAVVSNEGGTGATASASIDVVAPPTIAIAFSPATIALGGTSTLTISLTNPAGNDGAETGVAFMDTLPAGLVVATPNGLIDNAGGTATATAGSSSISLTGGSLAVGATDTIVVNVTGNTAGIENDTAGAVSSTNGGTGAVSNTASLTVAAPPIDTMGFSSATIPLNGTAVLTIDVTNPNTNVPFSGLAFTDTLPAGLVVASVTNLGNSLGGIATAVAGSSTVSLSGGSLAEGAGADLVVDVTGTTAGVKNNLVAVSSNEGGTGNTATASITVVAPPTIMQSFSAASIPLGGSTSLSFTVSNTNATTSLTGVGFMETLPAGLVIATPSGLTGSVGGGTIMATAGGTTVTLSGATLAAGSSGTFSINVTGVAAGNRSATTGAVTSTNGGTGTTASASIEVVAPPTIAIAFNPTAVAPNGTSTLTISLTNPAANGVAETGVAFTDILPTGLVVATPNGLTDTAGGTVTATAGSGSISFSGGILAVGATATITVNVTGTTAGIRNDTTGAVSSTNGGTGAASNTATLTVGNPPNLTAAFAASSIALNGSTTLTFTIANSNAVLPLNGVAFTDSLPAGLVVATPNGLSNSSPGGGTASAVAGSSTVSLSGATINAGRSITFSVKVTGTTAGVKSDSVQATSTNLGTSNTSTPSITVVAPPAISQSFTVTSIPLGSSTSLSFSILNANTTTTLTGVGFTETLPAGLVVATPNGLTPSNPGGTVSAVAGSSIVSLSGASIAAGSTLTFSINVKGTTAGTKNLLTSAVTSTQGGAGNTASASIKVVAPPTIAIAFNPTLIAPATTTTLTFTITNPAANTAALTGVAFSDVLPVGLTIPDSTTTVGGGTLTTTAATRTIALSGATIAVGGTLQFSVTVTGATVGNYTDVTSTETSTDGGTGPASNTVSLAVHPLLQVAQAIVPMSIYQNSAYTYMVTVSNLGSASVSGVTVRDVLPSNAVFLGSLPYGFSISGGQTTTLGHIGGVLTINVGTVAGNSTTKFVIRMYVPYTTGIGATISNDISVFSTISGSEALYTSIYSFVVASTHWD